MPYGPETLMFSKLMDYPCGADMLARPNVGKGTCLCFCMRETGRDKDLQYRSTEH